MADVDNFLKITGIPGESQDRTHKDEIEVISWSWGLTRAGTAGSGGAAGRPAFREVSIQKRVDRSSPKLNQEANQRASDAFLDKAGNAWLSPEGNSMLD
jgi:type VI secretion system Hcp family effector